jgi:hypothetical protein
MRARARKSRTSAFARARNPKWTAGSRRPDLSEWLSHSDSVDMFPVGKGIKRLRGDDTVAKR